MISSSVHQRKSYTDMSRRGGVGRWRVGGGGGGGGGVYWNQMQMAFITTELFITGYTMGSCQTPPPPPTHTRSRGSHVSNVRLYSRVFVFQKVHLHSHLPFLIRPLSLWNVTLGEKKREDRGEKQSITIIPSKKKKKCSTINLNDWSICGCQEAGKADRQADISVYHNAQMHRHTCTSEGEGLNCNSEDREIVWKAAGVMMKTLWKETYYAFSFFSFPSVCYI